MERGLNEIFELRGKKYKAIESTENCLSCAMLYYCNKYTKNKKMLDEYVGNCGHKPNIREDNKQIIFKQII